MTNTPKNRWVLPVLEGDTIEFPDDLTELLGWQVGDELTWEFNDDGTFTLSKVSQPEKAEQPE